MNRDVNGSIFQVVGAISDSDSQVVVANLFDLNFVKGPIGIVLNIDVKYVVLS